MKLPVVVAALALLQFVPRVPLALSQPGVAQRDARRVEGLTPAETLLEPEILRAIAAQAPNADASTTVAGTDANSDVLITCRENQCGAAMRAARRVSALVIARKLAQPIRSIRVVSTITPADAVRVKAAIHVAEVADAALHVVRSLWSHPSVADEVMELFARQNGAADAWAFEPLGQLALEPHGVSSTTIVVNPAVSNDRAAVVAAAAAYFLATLPNAGSEALLSHLTVGAHARLAEDGRKAVAQMGAQQRAGADVLIMFGQAIEREQRRMRSFESFMPAPVDSMLRSRIADMENGITSVWTSMGITSSPFVPAAQRIRGRGGEDRRVPSRVGKRPISPIAAPTAFLTYPEVNLILYELTNFIDGKRSISDIRDAVSAEFRPLPVSSVTDYFDRLAAAGAVTLK